MNQYKQLIKKSGLYFIGNISSKFVNVALIPLYAFFLSSDDLGIYDYLLMLTTALGPFAFMAMWEAVLRYTLIKEDDERYKIIGTSSITFISMTVGILLLMILSILIFSQSLEYILLVSIMIICDGSAKLWQYFSRGLGHTKDYVMSSIISTLINFVLNVVLLCFFDMGYYALFLAYSGSQIAVMIILEKKVKVMRFLKKKYWDFSLLKEMLLFSLPLVLNLSSVWFISGYARTIVFSELGTFYSGMYAFASKFGTIVLTLGSVFSLALIEESIIRSKEDGFSNYFNNVLKNLIELLFIILVLLSPIITIFYHIIGNTEYASSISLFPFFLLFAMMSTLSTSVGAVFQAVNKTKYQAITTIFGGLVVVGLTHFFINKWGVAGAAVAQLLGVFTMLILRLWAAYKLANISIYYFKPIVWFIVYVVTSILCINLSLLYVILYLIGISMVICILQKDKIINIYLTTIKKRKKLVRGL